MSYHASPMTDSQPPFLSPPEPAIDRLGAIARLALRTLRGMFWVAGAMALAVGVYAGLDPHQAVYSERDLPPLSQRIAENSVWWCLGAPLVTPVGFLLGSGRWYMLGLGTLLCVGPCLLPGDHDYGVVLRVFASFVGTIVLVVWRVAFGLTTPGR